MSSDGLGKVLLDTGADQEAVSILESSLLSRVLNFKVDQRPIDPSSMVVAFAFGNRRLPNGNVAPGPVNEALASCVVALASKVKGKLFAQWEIAESAPAQSLRSALQVVYPTVDVASGSLKYLSTLGVLRTVRNEATSVQAPVAIIAHHDHVWRCLHLAKLIGLEGAYVPAIELPRLYDSESAQGWTRNRERYLFHELHCRIELERCRVNGTELPG